MKNMRLCNDQCLTICLKRRVVICLVSFYGNMKRRVVKKGVFKRAHLWLEVCFCVNVKREVVKCLRGLSLIVSPMALLRSLKRVLFIPESHGSADIPQDGYL